MRLSRPRALPTGAALVAVVCALAGGQAVGCRPGMDPPLLLIEDLFADPAAVEARLSPDGSHVAYLRTHLGKLNVHVRSIDSTADRPVTADSVRPLGIFEWSADGRRMLYLQDNGGDEGFHLFSVDLDAGSDTGARDLTPYPGIEVELLAVPRATPDTVLITMNRRNPALADAYRLDLATGALDLAAENPGTFIGYLADRHNRVRVAQALDAQGRYHLLSRPDEADPWIEIAVYPVTDRITPLRFHPDGRRVYLLSNHGSDLLRLVLKDVTTGEESVVDEDPLGRVDIDAVVFDEDGGLAATRYVADTVRWYPHTASVGRLQSAAASLRRSVAEIGPAGSAGRNRVVRVGSPSDPGASYLYRDDTGELSLLFESRPVLTSARLAATRPMQFTTRDGLTVHGYLTLPPGREPRGLSLLLSVHGGPWSRDLWQFEAETQLYANRGYAVLQVNYRGSTGYGKRFARAAAKAFAREMHDDLLDAVQWAVDSGVVDPGRVAILGGSYGGYAALVGLTFTPDVFACAVDYAGPSNLVTLIEAFPPSWGPFLPRSWYPFVGNPADPADRRDLDSRSPLLRVDSARAPLLIFQGANDPRVPREQSDRIARALHARGVPVTYLLATNEGHSFGNRETSLAVTRATEVFLGKCLGGRVQPTIDPEVERVVRGLTVDPDTLSPAVPR